MSPIAAISAAAARPRRRGSSSGDGPRRRRSPTRRASVDLLDLRVEEVDLRRQPATVSTSDSGRFWTASQARPPTPKRSVAGERPSRQRERTAWTSFLALVRWRTRAARRATRRRSAWVAGVGDPDRVEHAGRQQAGQGAGIEAVGLDPGMGDRPHVLGVGDDHPGDVRFEDPGDLHRRAGRLHHHLVYRAKALGEELQLARSV